MQTRSNTPYDDVFRTLITDCTELIIPAVNEFFHEHYYYKEESIRVFHNEFFIQTGNGNTKERITDSHFEINGTRYHIECQSTSDNTMIRRMFEYDAQVALENSVLSDDALQVEFPHSAVVYLRHNDQTPNSMKVTVNVPGGSCEYRIPVIRVQDYSMEEIFNKNLLFLIPFHIFKYEKELDLCEKEEKRMEQLKFQYRTLMTKLDDLACQGEISEYIKKAIVQLSVKVLEKIAVNQPNIKKEIGDNIMGGKILEYEAKTIHNEGIAIGEKIGEKRGIAIGEKRGIAIGEKIGAVKALYDINYTVDAIAAQLRLSVEEVESILES